MSGGSGDTTHRTLPSEASSVRAARAFVGRQLQLRGAPDALVTDLQLAVSELVTNMVVHGDGSPIDVVVRASDPRWWEIEVAGGSRGLPAGLADPATWTIAPAGVASGRGLGIVRRVTDEVVATQVDGRLVVTGRVRRA